MRQNNIVVSPGYDGEFGKIKIFNNQEREKLLGQKALFELSSTETVLKNKQPEPIFQADQISRRLIQDYKI